ncbi:MAG TPA: MarR family winged helix-turn-helix transcriptional regulator [Blastocatellia bacterium]|nr:MarR family winged helix-turn-helix transcriptional regulator [Blastocatellia bacterium]
MVDRALVRIRRSQSRRSIGTLMQQKLGSPMRFADIGVADALQELLDAGVDQPTVGEMAERLGIEPSRASRMTASAVRAGLVKRIASQSDGRRSHLALTASGVTALETVRRFRVAFFAQLMSGWADQDRSEFARLLTRFTDSLVEAFTAKSSEAPSQEPNRGRSGVKGRSH